METFVLQRADVGDFLTACATVWQVHVPVAVADAGHRYAALAEVGVEAIALDALRTMLPAKKYFFPPEEALYTFDVEGYRTAPLDAPPLCLFGLHPCDLHGLDITDRFFDRDHPDRTYRARRRNTVLIGLGCMPDAHCFCSSVGSQHIDALYDVFLWDLGDRFYVLVRSEAGHDLIHRARDRFTAPDDDDRRAWLALLDRRRDAFSLHLDVHDLPQVLETQTDAPVWRQLGAACFACGACSMVCPTCTCYDLFDRVGLDGAGERCRRWDSCLFRDFDRVAGNHHFRTDRGDRVRNRYYHKEHGYVAQFGAPSCVGCGRCIEACPAGIDIVSVFRQVRVACGMEAR